MIARNLPYRQAFRAKQTVSGIAKAMLPDSGCCIVFVSAVLYAKTNTMSIKNRAESKIFLSDETLKQC